MAGSDHTGHRRRRFQPFKKLQRLFRRRVKTQGDDDPAESAATTSPGRRASQRRRQGAGDSSPSKYRLSMSHDSIFQTEGQQQAGLDSAASIPSLPSASSKLTAELRSVLTKKRSDDADDDPGLPRSPASPPDADRLGGRLKGPAGKSGGSCSDGSMLSIYSSGTGTDDDIFGPLSAHSSKLSLSRDQESLDLEAAAPLSHAAAKHRIAVRPRRAHTPQRPRRPGGRAPAARGALPATLEEEALTGSEQALTPTERPDPGSPTCDGRRSPAASPERGRATLPADAGGLTEPDRLAPVQRSRSSLADRRLRDLSPRKLWARGESAEPAEKRSEGFFSRLFGSRRSGRKRKGGRGAEPAAGEPAARSPSPPAERRQATDAAADAVPRDVAVSGWSARHADVIRPAAREDKEEAPAGPQQELARRLAQETAARRFSHREDASEPPSTDGEPEPVGRAQDEAAPVQSREDTLADPEPQTAAAPPSEDEDESPPILRRRPTSGQPADRTSQPLGNRQEEKTTSVPSWADQEARKTPSWIGRDIQKHSSWVKEDLRKTPPLAGQDLERTPSWVKEDLRKTPPLAGQDLKKTPSCVKEELRKTPPLAEQDVQKVQSSTDDEPRKTPPPAEQEAQKTPPWMRAELLRKTPPWLGNDSRPPPTRPARARPARPASCADPAGRDDPAAAGIGAALRAVCRAEPAESGPRSLDSALLLAAGRPEPSARRRSAPAVEPPAAAAADAAGRAAETGCDSVLVGPTAGGTGSGGGERDDGAVRPDSIKDGLDSASEEGSADKAISADKVKNTEEIQSQGITTVPETCANASDTEQVENTGEIPQQGVRGPPGSDRAPSGSSSPSQEGFRPPAAGRTSPAEETGLPEFMKIQLHRVETPVAMMTQVVVPKRKEPSALLSTLPTEPGVAKKPADRAERSTSVQETQPVKKHSPRLGRYVSEPAHEMPAGRSARPVSMPAPSPVDASVASEPPARSSPPPDRKTPEPEKHLSLGRQSLPDSGDSDPVVLRRKPASCSEESELLKVFKRRSLKIVGSDEPAQKLQAAPAPADDPAPSAADEKENERPRADDAPAAAPQPVPRPFRPVRLEDSPAGAGPVLTSGDRQLSPASPPVGEGGLTRPWKPTPAPPVQPRPAVAADASVALAPSAPRPRQVLDAPRPAAPARQNSESRRVSQQDDDSASTADWLKQTVRERREQREQREQQHLRKINHKELIIEPDTLVPGRVPVPRSSRVLEMANTFQKLQPT